MEISELKRKAGIEPYRKRLRLKKVSREYKACCPWHNDRNPSLAVFEKDGEYFWKCFSCTSRGKDTKGDLIQFVEKFDHLTFKDALAQIKTECGLGDDSEKPDFVEFKYDQKAATAQLDKAAEFLRSRGVSLDLACKCGIGYCDYPGIGPAVGLPYNASTTKFRAISPVDKDKKFRHLAGSPSADLLFGLDTFDSTDYMFTPEIWVLESELDSLTMRSHGFSAVSVSSATTCVDISGKLKIKKEHLDKLLRAEKIFLALDADAPGQRCADAFEKAVPSYKTFRVMWPYGGKDSADPKDVGELFLQSQDRFKERIEGLKAEALDRKPRLITVESDLFLTENIPPRKVLLETTERKSPILYEQSLNQLFAWRGTGKTNIALGLAQALATGEKFLNWRAPEPVKVLYVEGELPASQMQERVRQIVGKTNNGNLRIITLDKQQNNEIPSLATPQGQALLEDQLKDSKFIFLDSISTLFNIATNDEDNWLFVQNWFRKLRSKGYALMFLHHAGKSGLQRGSSKSEDMLDISIQLTRPEDYHIEEGLRVKLEFDKTRGAAILDGAAIEVKMETPGDQAIWAFRSSDDAIRQLACEMFKTGLNPYQVAKELNRAYSTCKFWHKQWLDAQRHPQQGLVH